MTMTSLQLVAGLCLLLILAPSAAAQSADERAATPREKSESQAPQRRLRLNGLGVAYQTKRDLSLDVGYRPGFGSPGTGGTEPQRGFFLGVKKRF
jgi:hypothetical protein